MSTVRWRTLAVAAIAASVVLAVPLVVDDRFLLKVFTFVGINVLTVAGLSLVFGYAGQVSMGHAAFLGIGAYTSAYLTVNLGAPWVVGVAAAMAFAAAGGLILALPSLRLKGHYLAMATLGFGEIMHLVFVESEPITGGVDGFTGIPFPAVGSFEFRTPQAIYWLVWGLVVLSLFLLYNIVRQRPGRAMRALHGSELGAKACGIDTTALKVQVFVVSAVLAGLAGALYAHAVGFVSPSLYTLHASIILVAMTVLGGTASLAGPVLAAILLTLLQYVDAVLPGISREAASVIQDWQSDIYGLVIILVMLFAPGGMAGAVRRVFGRRGSAALPADKDGVAS